MVKTPLIIGGPTNASNKTPKALGNIPSVKVALLTWFSFQVSDTAAAFVPSLWGIHPGISGSSGYLLLIFMILVGYGMSFTV